MAELSEEHESHRMGMHSEQLAGRTQQIFFAPEEAENFASPDSFDVDFNKRTEIDAAELGAQAVDLDRLLQASDIVTAHVPLNSSTRGMFGSREFGLMKKTAVFVNTCRGPVHNEADLIRALQAGEIAGAGLDVLEQEPTNPNNPLLQMPNVVVTPHWAGGTGEASTR